MNSELSYGNRVRIKGGFYKNCVGILTDIFTYGVIKPVYEIEITKIDKQNCCRRKTITTSIDNIEKLEQ